MTRFVVINAILLTLVGAYLLAACGNAVNLAFMSTKDMEKNPNYLARSALMEVSINPVLFLFGLILLLAANAAMFANNHGPEMTKSRYVWGGLCLCAIAFIAMMMPVLMVPLLNYMDTTVKEVKELGYSFQVLVVIRFVLALFFILAGAMAIRNTPQQSINIPN